MKAADRKNRRWPRDARSRPLPGLRVGAKLALLAAGLLAVCIAHFGCSEKDQYQVLSFFFDGVPKPGERVREPGKPTDPNAVRPGGPARVAEEVTIASAHADYEDRKCFNCHGSDISVEMASLSADVCKKCHKAYFAPEPTDWTHGPVAAGECSICHKAHESEHQALLKAPQPDACLHCHSSSLLERPYHADIGKRACSVCHDPHLAGNRLLLADSRTYARRKIGQSSDRSQHAPWKEHKCAECHIVEQSYALIEDVNGACLKCHGKDDAVAVKEGLHAPVREGKCLSCHLSHESPRAHLVRPAGGKICFTCHKPQEIQGPNHPRVDRVDCLLCHKGHRSGRKHLLKDGIGQYRSALSAGAHLPPSAGRGRGIAITGEGQGK
jgi:predicted CXXCH cytochrome family protein